MKTCPACAADVQPADNKRRPDLDYHDQCLPVSLWPWKEPGEKPLIPNPQGPRMVPVSRAEPLREGCTLPVPVLPQTY